MSLRQLLTLSSVALFAAGVAGHAGEDNGRPPQLPQLDGTAAIGIEIDCRPAKSEFRVGEPVNMRCTLKNTTDQIKPIPWHTNVGLHFCCVKHDHPLEGGVLPRAFPQLRQPHTITSSQLSAQYTLYLPPQESVTFLLTYQPSRPTRFKGFIRYDPMAPRMSFDVSEGLKNECAYSNEFEYEVVQDTTR